MGGADACCRLMVGMHKTPREQLKSGKLVVKLFLRHQLHAKLYLVHQGSKNLPAIPVPGGSANGFVSSSNLRLSGLRYQGELNVDVLEHDATEKLQHWFDDRRKEKLCLDISKELIQIIDESWVTTVSLSYFNELRLLIALAMSSQSTSFSPVSRIQWVATRHP